MNKLKINAIALAVTLAFSAGAMAEGGEVFVLDMGQPGKIIELARRMAELAGFRVRDSAWHRVR